MSLATTRPISCNKTSVEVAMSMMVEKWSLPDAELKPALALALELEHTSMGLLLLRDKESGELELALTEGLTPEQSSHFGHGRPGLEPVGRAMAERRRLFIADAMNDGNGFSHTLQDTARAVGFRGLDVVPLELRDGTAIGAVTLLFPRVLRPRGRAVRLEELCARLLAVALHNARRRAEAEARCTMAEGAARSRVQFVARMSHELRTPLQSITGYIDLLKAGSAGPLTPRQREVLDRVGRSERMLISVVDDLVTLARLEARDVDHMATPIRVRDAIASAEAIVAPLAQRLGISVEVDMPDADLVVRADERKVAQILVNLLTNAVKFTQRGGSVHLSCRHDESQVYIDVADTGFGISPEKLATVFDPYARLGPRVPQGYDGVGLGLAISREFAKAMGGTVTVDSVPGRGSTFTVRLRRYCTYGC
jgi:signal transduction histidine kinase